MSSDRLNAVLAALLFALLTGCSHHGVWVTTAVDPELAPSRSDPVFVTLPEKPTIDERQMLLLLKDELCRNSFNVVMDADQAKWVMTVAATQYTYVAGTTGRSVAVPVGGLLLGSGNTQVNYKTDKVTYVYVSKSSDRIELEPRRYWEGRVTAADNVWRAYRTIIYKPLLDQYGRDYDRFTEVSKSYLKRASGCQVEERTTLIPSFGG